MALIGNYASLPVVLALQDIPAEGPYAGYQVIIASLGRVYNWNGSAWVATLVDSAAGLVSLTVLAGTLTGTVTGTMADVANIALSTANTYTDAAVNTAVNAAILQVNLELKELQTKLNALIDALN